MPSPAYLALLDYLRDLHVRKSAGYDGVDRDIPFANMREATEWGTTPLLGVLVRMGDKYRRAQNIVRSATNEQVGEGLRDTLLDLGAYALIAVTFLDEQDEAAKPEWKQGITEFAAHRYISNGGDGLCSYCGGSALALIHDPELGSAKGALQAQSDPP